MLVYIGGFIARWDWVQYLPCNFICLCACTQSLTQNTHSHTHTYACTCALVWLTVCSSEACSWPLGIMAKETNVRRLHSRLDSVGERWGWTGHQTLCGESCLLFARELSKAQKRWEVTNTSVCVYLVQRMSPSRLICVTLHNACMYMAYGKC